MVSGSVYAVIALLVVLTIIAVAAWLLRRRGGGGSFMPGDPAPRKLQSAVYMIGGDLDCIARLTDAIEERGGGMETQQAPGGAAAEAAQCLAGARQAITEIRFSVKRLRLTVGTMTPTYLNVLGLYRGLRDCDAAFGDAATDLEAAGQRMAALSAGAAPAALAPPARQELRAAGARLHQLSTCLRNLGRTVHHLGAALDLE